LKDLQQLQNVSRTRGSQLKQERKVERRRVVVTGIGAITPIGLEKSGLWDGLLRRKSAVRSITRFDPSIFRSRNAAEINDYVPTDHLDQKRAKRLDRFAQFSVVAARMALEDAEIDLAREDRDRVGSMMGTALGGIAYAEGQLANFLAGGLRAVDATLALAVFGGASSCNIAIELGVNGPNSTNAMSCASGTIAIGEAFRQIRDGYADVMITGGAEAPLAPLCFGAFALIRAMSTRNDDPQTASRPFDKDRDGFVMGEGSAVLILEDLARARARGARIYAEILGFGTSNDAYHMTAPRPDGSQAARSMRLALDDAHIAPHEIDYINTHGSSTPLNDSTETLAIKTVFGDHAAKLALSGTKGYYGHALGASGAIEAAICSLALQNEWLPPTVNLAVADDACDLNFLPGSGLQARVEHILSNSFGFGGINAALVMRRAA
jgi:3-oxoacyl-[acyl-carrier-protein] synthase II